MTESASLAAGLAKAAFAVVALAYATYGGWLLRAGLLKRPLERAALPYAAAVASTAAWGVAGLLDIDSSRQITASLVAVFDQLRYAAWALFLLALLRRPEASGAGAPNGASGVNGANGGAPSAVFGGGGGRWRRAGIAAVLGLAAVDLGADLVFGFAPEHAPVAWRALIGAQLGWAVLGLVLVEQVFRNQDESARWSAKPLCLGLGGLCVYDLYLYAQAFMFGGFDADALAARGLVHAVVVPLLWMASRRQAHWLARVQVSRTAAFYSASLVLIGVYLLFIAAAGYWVKFFGGSWGGALQVALLAAALVALTLLIFSGALRARMRVFLGKHFFSYRYDYRLEWLRFTAMLSQRTAPQEVGKLVVRGLADMVECPAGALWLKALGEDRYVQSAVWNLPPGSDGEATDSPMCRFMREREWIVDVGAARAGTGPREEAHSLSPWLLDAAAWPQAWLVVPLLAGGEMLGFVLLMRPRTELQLDWEVRDLLKTAARQAAGFLAQMHATEALLEARKFDAFNRMSAFVVHDLKNIVTQLSLMMKNAERHRDNPEFQQDMLATVESSLDKMRQMMLQLREGARPAGVTSGVDLAPILQAIQRSAAQRGRKVDLEIVDRIATRGHEQRLARVIGHVVQNALDATPASGSVRVELKQVAGRATVTVADTGAGMSREFIQTRLFRPFHSTKSSGMGIGSYESYQYLKELGGAIDVESEVGRGSVVTLAMPLFESGKGSDLRVADTARAG